MALLLLFLACLYPRHAHSAGGGVSGHKTCSVVKLYPSIGLTIKIENVSHSEFKAAIYDDTYAMKDFFHAVEHAVDYAFNKSYDYAKNISNMLAYCDCALTNTSTDSLDSFELVYDLEAYDKEYKHKMEKLFAKTNFADGFTHELEHYFH